MGVAVVAVFARQGSQGTIQGSNKRPEGPKNLIPDKSMDQSQNVIWSKHHLFQEESRSSDNCLGRVVGLIVKGREIGQKIGRKATAAAASQRHAGRERERGTLLLCQAGEPERKRESMDCGKGKVRCLLSYLSSIFEVRCQSVCFFCHFGMQFAKYVSEI